MKLLYVLSVKNPTCNGVVTSTMNQIENMQRFVDVAVYDLNNNICRNENNFFCKEKYRSISSLANEWGKPDLIVFNEVYKKDYISLYKECIRLNIPYIIIPHGCLVKKAQQKKFLKKKIANLLFFDKFIKNASAIQFLNIQEKNSCDRKYINSIVSGNGIKVSSLKNKYTNKNFIYIGRYDYKVKGLDLLIKTIREHRKWFCDNNVRINLYGRNAGEGYNLISKMILKYKLEDIIYLNGPIYNQEKEDVLLHSYSFIQVSRHEGQPMGIMEALSYGVPCITTYGTSFGEYINKNQCGIGINFSERELFDAIKKMFDDEKFRNECSKNSKIVNKDFNIDSIIGQLISEYKRIIKEEVK